MDKSWLFENQDEEEPSSDEEDRQAELEERLYAVVHHNDLSRPLPSELDKYYSLHFIDNREFEVRLNNSLDFVKSGDSAKICNLLKSYNEASFGEVEKTNAAVSSRKESSDFVFVSSGETQNTNNRKPTDNSLIKRKHRLKRFRYYSDEYQVEENNRSRNKKFKYNYVTLKECQKQEANAEPTTADVYYFSHDYELKMSNGKYKHLKVPPPPSSNWNNYTNPNCIIGGLHNGKGKVVVNDMTNALIELNPKENKETLYSFAIALYNINSNVVRKKRRAARKKARKRNQPIIYYPPCDIDSSFNDHSETIMYNQKGECSKRSISLNNTQFKLGPSTPQAVDLSSDIENNTSDIQGSTDICCRFGLLTLVHKYKKNNYLLFE